MTQNSTGARELFSAALGILPLAIVKEQRPRSHHLPSKQSYHCALLLGWRARRAKGLWLLSINMLLIWRAIIHDVQMFFNDIASYN